MYNSWTIVVPVVRVLLSTWYHVCDVPRIRKVDSSIGMVSLLMSTSQKVYFLYMYDTMWLLSVIEWCRLSIVPQVLTVVCFHITVYCSSFGS